MSNRVHLTTWISRESKARFAELAKVQGVSESALLRRVVESALVATAGARAQTLEPVGPIAASGRISVRLRSDDLLLLRERSRAREMPTSTYVSLLVRSHLRELAPLPTAELEALKRSVAEVGAIGRNINQIARAVNEGQWPHGPNRDDLRAILRALSALRDHFKAAINANVASWNAGYEKADR
jgi:Bacterial mobilisation protein (MobC)